MKNQAHTRSAEVVLPLAVPTGTKSGMPVLIGTAGLFGVAETDQYVASAYTGLLAAPQGLKDGQASVVLTGVHLVVYLPVDAAGVVGAPVYLTSAGAVTLTAGSNQKIGYLIDAAAAATVLPALGPRVALDRG
jgi:predicted RecA/RadA family phage recombinase